MTQLGQLADKMTAFSSLMALMYIGRNGYLIVVRPTSNMRLYSIRFRNNLKLRILLSPINQIKNSKLVREEKLVRIKSLSHN